MLFCKHVGCDAVDTGGAAPGFLPGGVRKWYSRSMACGSFSPRLDILPEPQQRVWRELCEVPAAFVLYGGTAIALHLGHRVSVDFDFFGDRLLDPTKLMLELSFLADARVIQREPNTLSCVVDRGGPNQILLIWNASHPPFAASAGGAGQRLQVASLLDLAGMKAAVVQMRAEAKDYIDIDALLRDGRLDLATALASGLAIYGASFNPQSTLKALSYFEDGDLPELPQELRDRLARAARSVDLDQLPAIGVSESKRNH
jgi:nucleotidyltransferase AbiEii toxin of type IV toxin-antitoxin system